MAVSTTIPIPQDFFLAPCPFCGVTPKMVRINCLYPEGQFHCYNITCMNRKCSTQPSVFDHSPRSKKRAATLWNTRA
jgi:hypothetical protein